MKKILALAGCLVFLCGTVKAQSGDPMAIENRMEKLQKEMEKVRSDFGKLQRKPVQLAPEETGIVLEGYERRLSEIEEKIQNLTGQIEVLEHKIDTEAKNNKKIKEDNDLRFQMIEKKVNAFEEKEKKEAQVKAKAEKEKKEKEAKAKAEKDKKAAETKKPVAAKPADKPAEKPAEKPVEPKKLSERDRYNAAFALVRENKYDTAIKAMEELIKDFPNGKYTSNAYYWMAECYYVQKKYDKAALAFGDGFQKVKKGAKAPDSLYRLGVTFSKLGKMEEACMALYSVEAEFPDASADLKKKVEDGIKEYKCE